MSRFWELLEGRVSLRGGWKRPGSVVGSPGPGQASTLQLGGAGFEMGSPAPRTLWVASLEPLACVLQAQDKDA